MVRNKEKKKQCGAKFMGKKCLVSKTFLKVQKTGVMDKTTRSQTEIFHLSAYLNLVEIARLKTSVF